MKGKNLININVFIDRDELRLSVENIIKNRFREKFDLNKAGLWASIKEFNDLNIDLEENQLIYSADITMELQSEKIKSFKAEAQVFLKLNSEIKFDENWKLHTKTSLIEHNWISKPKLNLSVFSIPGTGIAELLIGMLDDRFCKDFDNTVAEKADLSPFVSKLENQIQNPVPIKEIKNLHVSLEAETVRLHLENYSEKYFRLKVQAAPEIEIFAEEKKASSVIKKFPKCAYEPFEDGSSQLEIPVNISYAEIEKNLLDQFEEIKFKDRSISLQNINISSKGEPSKIQAQVGLKGDLDGLLKIECKPVLNLGSQKLNLEDFSYDFKSKNLFQRAVIALLKGQIDKKMKDYTKIDLHLLSQQIEAFSNNYLDQLEILPGVSLTLCPSDLKFTGMAYDDQGISITMNADAEISIQIYLQKGIAQA